MLELVVDCDEDEDDGERYRFGEAMPVGDDALEVELSELVALLTIRPSCTLLACAICPQPWPCWRSARTPAKREVEPEVAAVVLPLMLLLVEDGPPKSTACHWSAVAQLDTPALRSCSAASASAM